MTEHKNIEFPAYNKNRYGRPWAAACVLAGVKLEYAFIPGAYSGDDDGGDLCIPLETCTVYAYGQKDHRYRDSVTDFFYINSDGGEVKIKTRSEARKILIGKKSSGAKKNT